MPSHYAGDPYWTEARFAGKCRKCHRAIPRGADIFVYPRRRFTAASVYCDADGCGGAASRDFESARFDEDVYNRQC